jgi:hypothetical protein
MASDSLNQKNSQTHSSQTEAYSELFMELATNADAASAFLNGILPDLPKVSG